MSKVIQSKNIKILYDADIDINLDALTDILNIGLQQYSFAAPYGYVETEAIGVCGEVKGIYIKVLGLADE